MNIFQTLTWKNNYMSVFDALIYGVSGLHTMSHLLLFHCAIFFSSVQTQKLPTHKELEAIKCRRMRIITSLLYSVESPVPRSCLPSILSVTQLGRVWGNDLLCLQEKNYIPEMQKKCNDPDEQALWCNHKLHKCTCDLRTDPDTK